MKWATVFALFSVLFCAVEAHNPKWVTKVKSELHFGADEFFKWLEQKGDDMPFKMKKHHGHHKSMKPKFLKPHSDDTLNKYKHTVPDVSSDELPDSFDAREKWPDCMGLKTVMNQGECGGCWAFSVTSSLSDRLCIASGGSQNFLLSVEQLLSCCGSACTDEDSGVGGCDGAWPLSAYEYLTKNGIVTGGTYDDQYGCQPYIYGPCDGCGNDWPTPTCERRCTTDWSTPFDQDKHYASKSVAVPADVNAIMKEIYVNGPVSAAISVFMDFESYSSGVYRHISGKNMGGHAIKIIGWGTENDEDYWIIQNSWDTTWGENGFAKILRGVNEVGIEAQVSAGLARVDSNGGSSSDDSSEESPDSTDSAVIDYPDNSQGYDSFIDQYVRRFFGN